MEEWLYKLVQICTMLMELFGVSVLVYTAVRSFIRWVRKQPGIRLSLAQGIALALEFKLGGEVLRTVVVREWAELGILGAIIVLRGLLTFLIHWEIKNEEHALEREQTAREGGGERD
ncbi:MAG: DUF1622 domain-containing protein [Oscillospiraceae bacterium]|nr:DUF1622 domain-containing protein [Oscillospiraceae bacterium]